jgi:hypothetical protein
MADPPPCPACGEPLFGWVVVRSRDPERSGEVVLDRCEACGLGIVHGSRSVDLARSEGGVVVAANRRSWQAGIGAAHWAALEPPARDVYPTPQALGLLCDRAGLEPVRLRQPPLGVNQVWMWQTLLNAFTFHDNFALDVVRGRLRPGSSRGLTAFAIDALVSVVAALPVAIVALPLELLAVVAGRGGLIEAEVRRLRA